MPSRGDENGFVGTGGVQPSPTVASLTGYHAGEQSELPDCNYGGGIVLWRDRVTSRQCGSGMAIALSAPRSPTHSVSPAGSMAVGRLRPSSTVVTVA
jgi:hypothetical protein